MTEGISRLRRFIAALVFVPLAAVLVLFSVANRAPVSISLDPFAPEAPTLSLQLPLFVIIIGSMMLGVLIGGFADWVSQGRYRREARRRRAEVQRLTAERERLAAQGLPATIERHP